MIATLRDPLLASAGTAELPDGEWPAELNHDGRRYSPIAGQLGEYHEVPPDGHARFDGRPVASAYQRVAPTQGVERDLL